MEVIDSEREVWMRGILVKFFFHDCMDQAKHKVHRKAKKYETNIPLSGQNKLGQ
jgi:Mn-dependent DtxR family transcriptional regulator